MTLTPHGSLVVLNWVIIVRFVLFCPMHESGELHVAYYGLKNW
jgi:hypothetical protein